MNYRFHLLLFGLILSVSIVPSLAAQGEETSSPPAAVTVNNQRDRDSLFTEIHLGPNGVTAVGESEGTYTYDFDADMFVPSDAPVLVSPDEGDYQRTSEPVETRCTEQIDVPPFSESVIVNETEFVEGDIIATGRVTIRGWVKGSIRSLNKRVLVTETGRVDGDIEAPEITVKGSGIVLGNQIISETDETDAGSGFEEGFWVIFGFTLFFLILGFVLMSIVPVRMQRFENCIDRYRWRSAVLGVVLIFLMPFMAAIAIITIIGIPVAVALPIVFIYAGAIGVIVTGMRVASLLTKRFLPALENKTARMALGVMLIMSFWLLMVLFITSGDSGAEGFGIFLLVIAIMGSSFAVASGIGSAFLTRLGSREYLAFRDKMFSYEPAAPAPPPMPDVPPPTPPSPASPDFPGQS
jgi:hypothetical protein